MVIIYLLYSLLLFIFIVASVFIAYHINKYTDDPSVKQTALVIFVVGGLILLVLNIIFFFTTDWVGIFSKLKL